jgi:hypothetical protein
MLIILNRTHFVSLTIYCTPTLTLSIKGYKIEVRICYHSGRAKWKAYGVLAIETLQNPVIVGHHGG